MSQRYATLIEALGSAGSLAAVAPDDVNDLASPTIGLWVGGVGNVAVIGADDTVAVTFTAVAAGTLLPIRARRVMLTNTTATLMVALSSGSPS